MNKRKIFDLIYQRIIIILMISCLWLNNSVAFASDLNYNDQYMSPACKNLDDYQLKHELQTIVDNYFSNPNTFQVSKIVETNWETLGINQKIDKAVSSAISEVKNEKGIWSKFSSNWDKNQAKTFTETIINKVINSDELKIYLNSLSSRISNQVSRDLESAVSQSSEQGVKCLQQYIEKRYTEVFKTSFSQEIQKPDLDFLEDASPESKSFVSSQSLALGGLSLIIASQVGKRIANQVAKRVLVQLGERLLGRIGAAAIPVVGEIAGGVLIVIDVANSRNGALPEIEKEFKKPELKNTIKQQYIESVEETIQKESPNITATIVNELYSQWLAFKDRYQNALNLVEISPEFSEIFQRNKNQLNKLLSLLEIFEYEMGTKEILEIVTNGKFEEALILPEKSFGILYTHDIDYLLDYAKVAGNKLEQVVDLEIYKQIPPNQLNRNVLEQIIAIKDRETIQKISLLNLEDIQSLFKISTSNLIKISALLNSDQLSDLAKNLSNAKQDDANSVISLLLSDSRLMNNFEYLRDLLKSNNIQEAIKFWKKDNSLFAIFSGLMGMITFNIGWHFIADKFNLSFPILMVITVVLFLISLAIIGVIVFLIFRRLSAIRANRDELN